MTTFMLSPMFPMTVILFIVAFLAATRTKQQPSSKPNLQQTDTYRYLKQST